MVMELCDGGSLFERIHRQLTSSTAAFSFRVAHGISRSNRLIFQTKRASAARLCAYRHEERV